MTDESAVIHDADDDSFRDASGAITSFPGAGGSGVDSIAKAGSTPLTGDVTLTGGTNVTLTQAGQDISIAAAGGGAPSGSAGGVLDGTYPNPGLAAGVAGSGLSESSDVLAVNVDGSTIEISSDALRVKAGGIGANEIAATAVSAGSYGDATHVGAFTVDADGRLTAASSVAITGGGSGITALDYAEITSPVSVTATTEGTANTVVDGNSITYSGNPVMIEFWCPHFNNPASQNMFLVLLCDTTVLGRALLTMGGSAVADLPGIVKRKHTPSAGAHTYHVKAYVSSGTGSIKAGAGGTGADLPAYLQITGT